MYVHDDKIKKVNCVFLYQPSLENHLILLQLLTRSLKGTGASWVLEIILHGHEHGQYRVCLLMTRIILDSIGSVTSTHIEQFKTAAQVEYPD